MADKLWILNPFTGKVMRIAEDDPRLQKNGEKLAFFKFAKHRTLLELIQRPPWSRATPRDKYQYVAWGATEEEFCERYNRPLDASIDDCRIQIQEIEARIAQYERSKLVPKSSLRFVNQ